MRQDLSPTGRLHVVLHDPHTDIVVVERWIPNLVTTAGRTLLADLLTGTAQIATIALAVGDGDQAPAPDNTALQHELHRFDTELEATLVRDVNGEPRSVTSVTAVLPAQPGGATLTLREAGLTMTRLATGGEPERQILYNRVVFKTITKEPTLQMTLTWEVIF